MGDVMLLGWPEGTHEEALGEDEVGQEGIK